MIGVKGCGGPSAVAGAASRLASKEPVGRGGLGVGVVDGVAAGQARRGREWPGGVTGESKAWNAGGRVDHPDPRDGGAGEECVAPDQVGGHQNLGGSEPDAVGVDGNGPRGEVGECEEAVDAVQQVLRPAADHSQLLHRHATLEECRSIVGCGAGSNHELNVEVRKNFCVVAWAKSALPVNICPKALKPRGRIWWHFPRALDCNQLGRYQHVQFTVCRVVIMHILLDVNAVVEFAWSPVEKGNPPES